MHTPTTRARLLWLPLIALLLLGAGCSCTDPVTGESYFCLGEITTEEEAQLGAQYKPIFVAQSGGSYPDAELHRYLDEIVTKKMAPISHRPEVPWDFEILNTSQLNAFALPGGKVFVTRGLLALVESEAQFAHLMGHELGHVAHRHSMRGQGRSAVLAILVGTIGFFERSLLLKEPDEPTLVAGTVGGIGQVAFMKFGRDQELESDERGVDYAIAVGYDPREATKTFELFLRLKEESGQSESYITGLLSTHPLDSTRIDRIRTYIKEKYPKVAAGERTDLKVDSPKWLALRARIRREQQTYDKYDRAMKIIAEAQETDTESSLGSALQLLDQAVSELPDHATIRTGRAIAHAEMGNGGAAMADLDHAVSKDGEHYLARLLRGAFRVQTKQFQGAVSDLQKAESLFEVHPMPPYYLGEAYEGLGSQAEAIAAYRRCAERAPADSEVKRRAEERVNVLEGGA